MKYNKYKESGAIHHYWYRKQIPWYIEVANLCVERAVGQVVIDLGCGDGLVSKLLDARGYTVIGADNEESGLKLARELVPNAEFILKDLNDMFSPMAIYDYMVCLNTIEHLEKPENIVKIFRDNINQRGLIITDRPVEGRKLKGSHFKEYNIKELRDLFKDFKCREIGLHTPIFIALEVTK
ncbi:hypothetical protein LCGC14_1260790 [marine sediment metagenome]|uniref:Methyltransferase domain-containing protein n=1 Tax=marine sediment metagenome TaxID=412755 RepID=A0A0F9L0R3_9ZZZZ